MTGVQAGADGSGCESAPCCLVPCTKACWLARPCLHRQACITLYLYGLTAATQSIQHTIDITQARTFEKQNWMVERLNKLDWVKVCAAADTGRGMCLNSCGRGTVPCADRPVVQCSLPDRFEACHLA